MYRVFRATELKSVYELRDEIAILLEEERKSPASTVVPSPAIYL